MKQKGVMEVNFRFDERAIEIKHDWERNLAQRKEIRARLVKLMTDIEEHADHPNAVEATKYIQDEQLIQLILPGFAAAVLGEHPMRDASEPALIDLFKSAGAIVWKITSGSRGRPDFIAVINGDCIPVFAPRKTGDHTEAQTAIMNALEDQGVSYLSSVADCEEYLLTLADQK